MPTTILICGGPADGFQIVGLFADSGDAESYAEDHSLRDWWIAAENGNRESSGSIDLMTLDSPELAATYGEVSDGQFEHDKQLISDLEVRAGERVLDIGTGTGRLAADVAEIVGPSGRVI
jgi:SAM-dependent methyltransferase